jgi:AcrR family transcriptional regulator
MSAAESKADSRAARETIIEAAIGCIERDGLRRVTIRGIARAAGANSAAISYYFGSKKRLVDEALKRTLENAFGDWERLLVEERESAEESLRTVLRELLEGARKFPGLVKAHLYEPFINGRFNTPFVRRFHRFLAAMTERIRTTLPRGARRNAGTLAAQLASAVLLPALMPGLFRKCGGMKLTDPQEARAYIEQLLRHSLGPPVGLGARRAPRQGPRKIPVRSPNVARSGRRA